MGSAGPWGVVLFLWSWGIGKAPDSTGVLGRISRRKKGLSAEGMNHVWLMCLKSGVCETYDILWIHIFPKISKVITVTFKHQVGQIGCFLCLPATHTHTQNLWPPLTHMFPDKTDTRWCPSSLAKLANITPITMVYGRYIYTYCGYL